MVDKRAAQEVERLLEEHGCSAVERSVGKHLKWRFKTPGGNDGILVTGRTPSDHRAIKNVRTTLRHEIAKKDGSQ